MKHNSSELIQHLTVILASALRLLQPGGRQRERDERQMFGLLLRRCDVWCPLQRWILLDDSVKIQCCLVKLQILTGAGNISLTATI